MNFNINEQQKALESLQNLNGKELVEWWKMFVPDEAGQKEELIRWYRNLPLILIEKLRYYIGQWIDVAIPERSPNLSCFSCKKKGVADKDCKLFLDPNPSEVPMIFGHAEEKPHVIGTTISRWICPHCGEKS
jgi:hypothetical protein